MPSKFILEQAELLYRSQNPDIVLENLREQYAQSSFPSQMSRVKDAWAEFNDRNHNFYKEFEEGLAKLQKSDVSKHIIKEYKRFGKDEMTDQMKKARSARSGEFSGDEMVDMIIGGIPLLPGYMDEYKLSAKDKSDYKEMSSSNIEKRLMECIEIDDADNLLERVKKTIKECDTHDPFTVACCLSLVCGRRTIELLKTGIYSESSRGSLACSFSGAAKKKKRCVLDECDIPLLIKFKYFAKGLGYVRSKIDCDGLTNAQINAKYSHKLGDATKLYFKIDKIRFHDLRGLYGMISHLAFDNNCSINIWLQKSLLHTQINTSVFYSRFKIKGLRKEIGKWNY